MASLADAIERHIKELFRHTPAPYVEIRRAALADRFSCVPSQINYVLETRFTPQHGYVVESRRGGGGFIRIIRLSMPEADRTASLRELFSQFGDSVSARDAEAFIHRLQESGLIGAREAVMWRAAIRSQTEWVAHPVLRDQVRAAVLRSMLMVRFMENLASEEL